jgi:hypothetical protein
MNMISLLVLLQVGQISMYVSEKEAFSSPTAKSMGIKNTPTEAQYKAIEYVAESYFDPFRKKVGKPLYINSLFRSEIVNKAVGGAKNSDHLVKIDDKGHAFVAFDIDQDNKSTYTNREVFNSAVKHAHAWKIIWEFGTPPKISNVNGFKHAASGAPSWVHISWSTNPALNKGKYIYQAVKRGGKTIYLII